MARKITPTQNDPAPAGENNLALFPSSVIPASARPDKVAFVDLITAGGFNENLHTIRAMSYELGVGLKGSFNNLNQRISSVITPDGKLVLPETVFSVGKENADFTTIQAAIDAITDATPSKIYIVQVYPGIYEESVVMKPNILLKAVAPFPRGTNPDAYNFCVIAPPSGPCVKLTSVSNYYFEGMTFQSDGSPAFEMQSGYESIVYVHFHFGTVKGPEVSTPILASSHLIRFNFFKSRLLAAGSWCPLIKIVSGSSISLPAKFSHSFIQGSIIVSSPDITRYLPTFSFCYVLSEMLLTCDDTTLESVSSYFTAAPEGHIQIKTTGTSRVSAINSQFVNEDEGFSIVRHSGSNAVKLRASHCLFSGEPGSDIANEYSDGYNVFDKVIEINPEDF